MNQGNYQFVFNLYEYCDILLSHTGRLKEFTCQELKTGYPIASETYKTGTYQTKTSIDIYSYICIETDSRRFFVTLVNFCIHRSDINGHFALLPALDTSGSGFYVSLLRHEYSHSLIMVVSNLPLQMTECMTFDPPNFVQPGAEVAASD